MSQRFNRPEGTRLAYMSPLGLPPFRENWWFGFVLVFGLYKLFLCLNKTNELRTFNKMASFFYIDFTKIE